MPGFVESMQLGIGVVRDRELYCIAYCLFFVETRVETTFGTKFKHGAQIHAVLVGPHWAAEALDNFADITTLPNMCRVQPTVHREMFWRRLFEASMGVYG